MVRQRSSARPPPPRRTVGALIEFSPNKIRVGADNLLGRHAPEPRPDGSYLRTNRKNLGCHAPLSYDISEAESCKSHFVGGRKR